MSVFTETVSPLAIAIAEILEELYRQTLLDNRKYATRKTYNSIKADWSVVSDGLKFGVSSNQSLLFIIKGRPKGGRLPMRKVGGEFKLAEELELWKVAVGFTGPDFLLARSISIKGIKGVPITDMVLLKIKKRFADAARIYLPSAIANGMKARIKNVLA